MNLEQDFLAVWQLWTLWERQGELPDTQSGQEIFLSVFVRKTNWPLGRFGSSGSFAAPAAGLTGPPQYMEVQKVRHTAETLRTKPSQKDVWMCNGLLLLRDLGRVKPGAQVRAISLT